MANTQEYDAIVVGSGITGGWAAKELAEKGLNVLVLEAGRAIDPAKDYTEHVPPSDLRYRGAGDPRFMEENYPIQKQCYACTEYNHNFFVKDKENPYTTPEGKPYLYFRGRHVGGRSIMWGRQVYRWSDLDFEANAKEGVEIPWPIGYKDIEPWYDHVERFIGISGAREGLPQLPDGQFLPPMAMSCGEQHMRRKIGEKWNGERVLTIGRTAMLTTDHKGRAQCHYCGPCERGCVTRSYFNSLSSTLPAAEATGRLTLRPNSVVRQLNYDHESHRLSGVQVIDAETKQDLEFKARVVFLCASTLESTRSLLNSATRRFSEGLANSSGALGHYLMDHLYAGGAFGIFPGLQEHENVGRRPNGVYIARFHNVKSKHPKFLRGYGYQGGSHRTGFTSGRSLPGMGTPLPPGFGPDFKRAMKEKGPWFMFLGGFGECLPDRRNQIEINKDVTDKWGIPVLHITADWYENELAMYEDLRAEGAAMLEACGAKGIRMIGGQKPAPPGMGIHEMGTARMGDDPKKSVLNKWNQAHDVPNLFVTDGSCMTSSSCVNPSITYMALTARAADYAVEQMKKGEL